MKIATHDDTAKVDCVVKANENAIQEFNNHIDVDGNFVSWLPVEDGQRLTIDVGCNVYTKEAVFDLVVDGVLRNTVSSNPKEWALKRHTAKFHSAFQMVEGKPADCELVVKDVREDEQPNHELEGEGAVGRIEVYIWVLQQEGQVRSHHTKKSFQECADWRHLDEKYIYSTIQPTQEVKFTTNDCSTPTAAKLSLLKKRLVAARPGEKPWVTFQFYYRTQDAINQGGMLRAPKHTGKNMLKFTPPPLPNIGDEDDPDQADEQAPVGNDLPGGTKTDEVAPDLGSVGVEGADLEGGGDGQGPDLGSEDTSITTPTTEESKITSDIQISETTTTTTMLNDAAIAKDPNGIVDHKEEHKSIEPIEGSEEIKLTNPKPRALTPVDSKTGSLTPEPTPKTEFAITKPSASRTPTPLPRKRKARTPITGTAKRLREENQAREVVMENMQKEYEVMIAERAAREKEAAEVPELEKRKVEQMRWIAEMDAKMEEERAWRKMQETQCEGSDDE